MYDLTVRAVRDGIEQTLYNDLSIRITRDQTLFYAECSANNSRQIYISAGAVSM